MKQFYLKNTYKNIILLFLKNVQIA